MVKCIAPGLTVTGIVGGRTFAVGDEVDPEAIVTREDGMDVTWREAIGPHLATHFTPEKGTHKAPDAFRENRPARPGEDTAQKTTRAK